MDEQKSVFDKLGLIFSIIIPIVYVAAIFAFYYMYKFLVNNKPDDPSESWNWLVVIAFSIVAIELVVLGAWTIVSIIGISSYKKGKPSTIFMVNAIAFTAINCFWTYYCMMVWTYYNVGILIAALAMLGFAVSNLIVQIKRNKLLA